MDYHRNHEHEQRRKNRSECRLVPFLRHSEPNDPGICAPGSLDEFLLERYTAFTQFGKCRRFFRIWHEPWRQVPAEIQIVTDV